MESVLDNHIILVIENHEQKYWVSTACFRLNQVRLVFLRINKHNSNEIWSSLHLLLFAVCSITDRTDFSWPVLEYRLELMFFVQSNSQVCLWWGAYFHLMFLDVVGKCVYHRLTYFLLKLSYVCSNKYRYISFQKFDVKGFSYWEIFWKLEWFTSQIILAALFLRWFLPTQRMENS